MKNTLYLLLGVVFLLAGCQKFPPTADFDVSVIGYKVTCENHSSRADAYSWNWGDNSPKSTLENPSHTYAKAGDYTITLSATNADGADSKFKTIHISQTGGGGSNDDDEVYTTFICNAIKVVNMPLYDGNERWDVMSDADLMIEIYENSTIIYNPDNYADKYIKDVSKLPVTYNLKKNVPFKKNRKYLIRLYDYDDASKNDLIGSVEFNGNIVFGDGNTSAVSINLPDGSIQLVLLGKMD